MTKYQIIVKNADTGIEVIKNFEKFEEYIKEIKILVSSFKTKPKNNPGISDERVHL